MNKQRLIEIGEELKGISRSITADELIHSELYDLAEELIEMGNETEIKNNLLFILGQNQIFNCVIFPNS